MNSRRDEATYAIHDTPCGPLTVIVDDDGAALALGWDRDVDIVAARIAPVLRPGRLRRVDHAGVASDGIAAYLDGDVTAIDKLTVRQPGSPFRARAWTALRGVKPGKPVTYSELAARSGNPKAARAAGSACATNAVALIVPCHRVIARGGSLGGFAWGTGVKRWLLDHEALHAAGN